MNSREIPAYKSKIMRYLIRDAEMIKLLDPNNLYDYPDEMLYKLIFPFNRVHDTEEEVAVYVCVMIDIPSAYKKNELLRNVTLKIRVYCHEDLMKVKGEDGDRMDLISARIDEMLNESFDFGVGPVGITSNTEHVLDSRHFFREIIFKTEALNNKRNEVNAWSR